MDYPKIIVFVIYIILSIYCGILAFFSEETNKVLKSFIILFCAFTAITFSSLLFTDDVRSLTEADLKIEIQIDKDIKLVEDKIRKNIFSYFDSLKKTGKISKEFEPKFSYQNIIKDNQRVLRSEFSYTTKGEKLKGKITDYNLGKYHLADSPSALSMLEFADITIREFFKDNFEQGEEIQLELHGFADATPFDPKDPKYYDGIEGDFPKSPQETLNGQKIYAYKLNGVETPIKLKEGDLLTNETLAFLRAYCLYSEYLVTVKQIREVESKTRISYHATTTKDVTKKGGKFRKVKFTIDIINPIGLPPAPEKKCNIVFQIFLLLLSACLCYYGFYHYKRYHEKRDRNEPVKKDLIKFLCWILIGIVCIILSLYFCQILFN
ncbi:hypothetical protein [uncultured Kordia sp.]|uniref:hypothetical protein n=1 Tax=uncultured Kordia sp. TaxID=507699 RepID=UPI0026302750|nr:hypothetical protein [uncultured Kordia sp.]